MSVGMKQPSKLMLIVLIAVIMVFGVIVVLLPEKDTGHLSADLFVEVDTDVFIGSIGVSCTRWDGSSVSGGVVNADGTPFTRGDRIPCEVEGWPAIISVCADPQGAVLLGSCLVEEAPGEGYAWQATVRERNGTVIVEPTLVERDP